MQKKHTVQQWKEMNKLTDLIEEIKDTIEWILNGCPKPAPIPVPIKDDKNGRQKPRSPKNR